MVLSNGKGITYIRILVLAAVTVAIVYCYLSLTAHTQVVVLDGGYRYLLMDDGIVIDLDPSAKGAKKRLNNILAREVEEDGDIDKALPTVGPDVDGFRVYGNVIVGHVRDRSSENSSAFGYFVIDVKHDRMYKDMDKQRWISVLHRFGLNSEPRLFKPGILDEVLGRNRSK